MRFILVTFFLVLLHLQAIASDFTVDWACPADSPKIKVRVSLKFNKLVLEPDIKQFMIGDSGKCFESFKSNFQVERLKYQKKNCQAAISGLCSLNAASSDVVLRRHFSISEPATLSTPVTVNPLTPESALEQKVRSGDINLKDLNQSFAFKGQNYKVIDFDRVIGNNIEKIFSTMNRDEARQYTQNYMLAKASFLKSRSPSMTKAQVYSNLDKMFSYLYDDGAEDELRTAIQCLPEDEVVKPLQTVAQKLKLETAGCKELNPGESKVFTRDPADNYGTGDYTLRRRPDGNYQALLNLKFVAGAGKVLPEEMLDRTKRCMAEASPAMKGPDGTKIEIIAYSPAEAQSLPPGQKPAENVITIESTNFATNAAAYAEDVGCNVITHEILHLMGLCDEYREDRAQFEHLNWTCRVVTRAPSIMRNTSDYHKAVGGTLSCICRDQFCMNIMRSSDEVLKKNYLSQNFYDGTEVSFRTKACKEEYVSLRPIQQSDKSAILLEQSENKLVFESRFISRTGQAPFYKMGRSRITCGCSPTDRDCQVQLKAATELVSRVEMRKTCPAGSTYKMLETGRKVASYDFNGTEFRIFSEPTLPSLLQPNHFYKILEGPCKGKSAPYQECASHAYKSPNPTCNVPEKCSDDGYYLGTRP